MSLQQAFQVLLQQCCVSFSAALQPLQGGDLFLPSSQHLIEWIFADGSSAGIREGGGLLHHRHHYHYHYHYHQSKQNCESLDAVDPFILLLSSWGRDPVKSVVTLDDTAVSLCLTRLDHLILVVGDKELEAVLQGNVTNRTSQEIYVNRKVQNHK